MSPASPVRASLWFSKLGARGEEAFALSMELGGCDSRAAVMWRNLQEERRAQPRCGDAKRETWYLIHAWVLDPIILQASHDSQQRPFFFD
jgi:hypothetical protein